MRRLPFISALPLLLASCAAPPASVLYHRDLLANPLNRATPNLVLGPSRDHLHLAQTLPPREDWPSVFTGYRVDESSSYTEIIQDDQFFYDSLGGVYFRFGEEVRTGLFVR
jgi:hypothetical protein